MKYLFTEIVFNLLFLIFLLVQQGCTPLQKENEASIDGPTGALQLVSPEICSEVKTGRLWQVGRSPFINSPREATEYAANLHLGGYSDWRLPTREELFSLYYIFFWKNNGECNMKQNGEYWTAYEDREPSPGHWEKEILCAPIQKYVKSFREKGYVRAVRP